MLHCPPEVAVSTKAFALQIASDESSKMNRYFVPLFFYRIDEFKVFTLNEFEINNFA